MNNYDQQVPVQAASILDKTDWRKTIHRCLETCVKTEGTTEYPHSVKSLVSAVSANYPGFKAKDDIDKFILELKETYKEWIVKFIEKNPDYWFHYIKRKLVEPEIVHQYWKDIFEYIKDLLAKRRILLYGVRQTPGGLQMPDEE